jgi:hypothetical protein
VDAKEGLPVNEAENTFRALKDQPPLSTGFWCRFGWHRWLKWEAPKRSPSSIYVRQGRYCANCNHYDERKFHE